MKIRRSEKQRDFASLRNFSLQDSSVPSLQLHISHDCISAIRAFDSALLERQLLVAFLWFALSSLQLPATSLCLWINSPCSTVLLNSSRTCNHPHHGIAPDRNRRAFLGVDLPAFCCQRTLDSDSIGTDDPLRIVLLGPWLSAFGFPASRIQLLASRTWRDLLGSFWQPCLPVQLFLRLAFRLRLFQPQASSL